MNTRYTVEVDVGGCEHCGAGKTWTVMQPDGVAIGRSFHDRDGAEDLCELLNAAVEEFGVVLPDLEV